MTALNKDTQFCISLASKPSNFGTILHNSAYKLLNLNFAYKAFTITDIAGAMTGVRALNIRGCSVSMPFKISVIPYLDALDDTAKKVGAVNTVVNKSNILTGYNTDVIGARVALESLKILESDSVLILGAGGVARSILLALRQLGISQVSIVNRNLEKIQQLNDIYHFNSIIQWQDREHEAFDVLINATSIGMKDNEELMPFSKDFISQSRAVMDVVISPMETALIEYAKSLGKSVAPGYLMSFEQLMAQFFLYTDLEAPRELMMHHLRHLLNK